MALYFMVRGPWRAIGSVNSYDFASVYGATRCWLSGENPYDMRLVTENVHRSGDDPATLPNTDPPPSVYLPNAFPLIASVAWLPWKAARLAWSVLSIAVFLFSALLIIRHCKLTAAQQWLLGAGVLLFSPTSSGLSTGNPSVISCALTISAVFLALERRPVPASILLGLALCIKPQISIAGVAIILLWGYWRIVAFSVGLPIVTTCISILRAPSLQHYLLWLSTLRNSLAASSVPGGINDPSPANYFSYHLVNGAAILSLWIHNVHLSNALGWVSALALAAVYLRFRRGNSPLRDIAFFCTLCLVPVYHRYYDAQLLLAMVPFLVLPRNGSGKVKSLLWVCLLVLVFPLQAMLAASLHSLNPASPVGFLLLRHQPLIILHMCVLLIPWSRDDLQKP